MSSDLLAKCLPCILSAIQSNLGLAYVLSGESSFTCSRVGRGDSEEKKAKVKNEKGIKPFQTLQMWKHADNDGDAR